MNDEHTPITGEGDELSSEIVALLGDPDMWDEVPDRLAEIESAIATDQRVASVTQLDTARQRRSSAAMPRWLGAAAAVALVVTGVALVARSGDDDSVPIAEDAVRATLTATELAPGASASAVIESTPAGLKIVLDVDGLPGAGPGEMYEAWISDGTLRVSAGTFHLREGDDPIALWAGVADPRFRLISVTLEPVDGVADSSGRAVLTGEYRLDPVGS